MNTNIVGIFGGLGNQMFQFTFGKWLEAQTGRRTVYDLSAFRTLPKYFSLGSLGEDQLPRMHSTRYLPFPGGRFPRTANALRRVRTPFRIIFEDAKVQRPSPSQLRRPGWYYGYWQSAVLTLPQLGCIRQVMKPIAPVLESVSPGIAIHVRRGDMLDKASVVDVTYFKNALSKLKSTHGLADESPIRIFSDDPDWCRINLNLPTATFSEGQSPFRDMTEMASFEYLVLSGSTFSWWAARLVTRNARTVVSPFPIMQGFDEGLQDSGWLRVPRG